MIHIFTVCTGPNYFPWHVERLYNQIKEHTTFDFKLYAYTPYSKEEFGDHITVIPIMNDRGVRQWYKLDLFWLAPKNQICFISDLDWTFYGDVTDILNQPVEKNELIAPYRWWTEGRYGYDINGGLYKFIGGDHTHIADTFYKMPEYYMQKYIDLGYAKPPVNGEQNFVEDCLKENNSIIKYFEPKSAIGRYKHHNGALRGYSKLYLKEFKKDFYAAKSIICNDVRMLQADPLDVDQLSRI